MNMTYRGHVSNGVVVLDDAVTLPEGLNVKVEPLETPETPLAADDDIPTLYERLKPFIGKAEGLPADASVNHDHYLYGTPKRE
jgi:hypothetical protein